MAWARDASASAAAASVNHTIGGGSDRLVCIGAFSQGAAPRLTDSVVVSYNGVAATGVATTTVQGGMRTRMYYLLDANLPSAGTYSVAADTTFSNPGIGAISFTGVDQSAPLSSGALNATTAGNSVSLTTTVSTGLAVSAWGKQTVEAIAATSPCVEVFEVQAATMTFGMGELSTAATSDTFDWSSATATGNCQQAAAWDIAAASSNDASGTPQAQAADATGTMSAPASASGTPQAGAATTAGTLKHVSSASGAPQAGAATAAGTATVLTQLSGSPQAGAATAAGTAQAPATMSGAPEAGAAIGEGTAEVLVQLSGAPEAGPATADGTATFGESISASGSPEASPAEAAGTLEAVASAAGTPQADAAEGAGTLQHRFSAAGTPQASAATSDGSMAVLVRLSGAPSAGAATAAGTILALASMSGATTAASATSAGSVGVVVSMSGAVQAGLATTSGFADDGATPIATAKRPPLMLINVGRLGQ